MSIAYLDPGNIESDLQSGAKAGFKVTTREIELAPFFGSDTNYQKKFSQHPTYYECVLFRDNYFWCIIKGNTSFKCQLYSMTEIKMYSVQPFDFCLLS